nr:uncharacterized protein LOC117682549 [Crassostrea gigas]
MMTSSVAEHLFASSVITDEMRQQIEVEKTSYDRNRKLLSIILRRGPRALTGLRMALLKSNQRDLSKLLAPENETVSEYDKKLTMARSLLVNMTETTAVENEPKSIHTERQTSQEEQCKISMDDFGDLFLTAVPFKEEINIHICYFKQSNGRYFATKKGVTFPLPRWVKFESLLPELEKYLQNKESRSEMKWHIGGGVYVSLHPGTRVHSGH